MMGLGRARSTIQFVQVDELIRWSRNCRRRWLALLLPGLLLRALIPVGFMPMFGPGMQLQLVMCAGYAPVPTMSMDMSADMPMDMPMSTAQTHHAGGGADSGGSDPYSRQDHSACPYGASPALAALPLLAVTLGGIQAPLEAPISAPQVGHFAITSRSQSARAPPLEV